MKFSLATLVPLAALAPLCSANFDVYKVGESLLGNIIDRWAIFDNDPSCNDVVHRYPNFAEYSRVNGDQTGVRCQGACGREDRADGIEQLEMNFGQNPLYHWSKFTISPRRGRY